MSPLLLAVDIGTSSSRTSLFTAAGERLVKTTAQERYELHTSADGAAELEPTVLLRAVTDCLRQTFAAKAKDRALRAVPIAAVGTSCFWHSLIGTDAAGRPLTRIITWADGRCRPDAAKLRDELSEKTIHARTGCMLRASYWPAKLVWLRRTQPRLFARVQRWMSPAEWLERQFCGEAQCALGMATGTGLFDPSRLQWDDALLRRCHLRAETLGTLSDEPAVVSGKLAARFPQLKGVPWFPGIGDGAASNLGSGATRPGLAAINVGTSAALRVMREGAKVRAPFGLFGYRVDAARYLVGGAISNAGNLRAWCLRELRLPEKVEEALATQPAPEHGLTVLPFWNAERAPTWNEELRGAITGVTAHTTALDLLQAITEATCLRLARIAALVVKEEKSAPKFLVSGGIQHSAHSMQRLADVLGHPIYANPEPEASIRGAAVFALEKLGETPALVRLPRAIHPRRRYAALYAEARERQNELEDLFTS